MALLKPRQSTILFGWWDPRPVLVWNDVLRLKLTLDQLIKCGLISTDVVLVQSDPGEWIQHAKAELKHARYILANPFTYFQADLADVLSLQLSSAEMVRMEVTYKQLVAVGMTAETERMFKFDADEWGMIGKKSAL